MNIRCDFDRFFAAVIIGFDPQNYYLSPRVTNAPPEICFVSLAIKSKIES